MIRNTAALALLCIAAPVAAPLAAQGFEGTVAMNITNDNGSTQAMTFMLKAGKIRFDPGAGGQVSVIIDPATQRMTVIMNAQKMYMERDFSRMVPAMPQVDSSKAPTIVKTGKFETIAGYKCEHITLTDTDGRSVDACMSSQLGGFRMPAASNPMAPQEESGWLATLGDRQFPLKVTKAGKTVLLVTSVQKQAMDATMFAPPDGYQSFEMPVRKKPRD